LCRSSALSAVLSGQPATQQIVGTLSVTDHATTACLLSGRPKITLSLLRMLVAPTMRPWNSSAFPGVGFTSAVLLRPRRSVSARFLWLGYCRDRLGPWTARVRIGPASIVARVVGQSGGGAFSQPHCPVADGGRQTISVTLWTTG
jgi:hypothetical protein